MDNSTAKLTKDCFIIPTACGKTDGFKTAQVHVEVFKNNLWVLWLNRNLFKSKKFESEKKITLKGKTKSWKVKIEKKSKSFKIEIFKCLNQINLINKFN